MKSDPLKNHIQPMPTELTKEFLYRYSLRHQASFIKKELFDKYGLYNENNKVVSDYEKCFVFLENGVTFKYLPYTITYFNTEGISCDKKTHSIALQEKNNVINKYFTKEELISLEKKYPKKIKYSLFEKIFSIKNDWNTNHKILTILGLKIKLNKRK